MKEHCFPSHNYNKQSKLTVSYTSKFIHFFVKKKKKGFLLIFIHLQVLQIPDSSESSALLAYSKFSSPSLAFSLAKITTSDWEDRFFSPFFCKKYISEKWTCNSFNFPSKMPGSSLHVFAKMILPPHSCQNASTSQFSLNSLTNKAAEIKAVHSRERPSVSWISGSLLHPRW